MTPRERADALINKWRNGTQWTEEISLDIEQAIIAATQEKDARIKELEEENAHLRHILESMGKGGGTNIN